MVALVPIDRLPPAIIGDHRRAAAERRRSGGGAAAERRRSASGGWRARTVPCRVVADLAQAAAWHRQVAALAAAADRVGVATYDLPAVRARLHSQQTRIAEAAARAGAPLPALDPGPSEISAAAPGFGDLSDASVARTLHSMAATLDAVDAALGFAIPVAVQSPGTPPAPPIPPTITATVVSGPGPTPSGPHPALAGLPPPVADRVGRSQYLRNGLIYGAYSAMVVASQALLFIFLDD
jgi:hypothetical protein